MNMIRVAGLLWALVLTAAVLGYRPVPSSRSDTIVSVSGTVEASLSETTEVAGVDDAQNALAVFLLTPDATYHVEPVRARSRLLKLIGEEVTVAGTIHEGGVLGPAIRVTEIRLREE
jgi:hypothetical protein